MIQDERDNKKKKKDPKTPRFFLKEIQELAALLIGLDWDVMLDKQKVIGLEAFSWGRDNLTAKVVSEACKNLWLTLSEVECPSCPGRE